MKRSGQSILSDIRLANFKKEPLRDRLALLLELDKYKKDISRIARDHLPNDIAEHAKVRLPEMSKIVNKISTENGKDYADSIKELSELCAEFRKYYRHSAEVLLKIRRLVEETEKETINRRPVTELVKTKLDQLFAGAQQDWQEIYPQAITQTVGDIDLYLAELRHVSSLKDFRSPDFLKVLENPDAFCFGTTRSWNQFVYENGNALNNYPPSLLLTESILTLLSKDTTGLASVPEFVLMKSNRQYYEETRLRSGRIRNQILQFRRNYKVTDPYIDTINKKITDIADSATSHRQAMLALLYLLEQIADEKSESPCLRLHITGTLLNDVILSHRDFLYCTVSWRYRSHTFLTMFNDTRCSNQKCTRCKEAEKLLAEFPINSLRRAAQTLSATLLPEPSGELRNRNLMVEYVWVGWADRDEPIRPEVIIRIKQENIPKTNFESALYAKLPDIDVMSVVGNLTENQAGIVPANHKYFYHQGKYIERRPHRQKIANTDFQ